ncbi:hypothetical protein BaRGS_00034036, partial [Batillaria attramentaria]
HFQVTHDENQLTGSQTSKPFPSVWQVCGTNFVGSLKDGSQSGNHHHFSIATSSVALMLVVFFKVEVVAVVVTEIMDVVVVDLGVGVGQVVVR